MLCPEADLLVCQPTATEGDIKASRPGLLDVLGRAKWCVRCALVDCGAASSLKHYRDAWNKRKGLSTEEAERLYVQGLLKVCQIARRPAHAPPAFAHPHALDQILKGFSDRPQAVTLIRELENFSLDPRAMAASGQ